MQILQVLWLAYFVVYLLIDYATCGGGQGWVGTRGKWRVERGVRSQVFWNQQSRIELKKQSRDFLSWFEPGYRIKCYQISRELSKAKIPTLIHTSYVEVNF